MEISDAADNKEHDQVDNSMRIGPPHEALSLALAYLPLFELLAMSEVSRSLRDAVNNDIIPWLDIIVRRPLNSRLSDDILMKITSKSNGRLRTLALINCVKITDYGLHRVIEKNPHISKIYIPACTGLSPDGVVRAANTLAKQSHNLISLKINGIYNIKKEHIDTLRSILGANLRQEQQQMQHNMYHEHKHFTLLKHEETDCPIDVDICPRCNQARLVFDCPREDCERKRQQGLSECRGCCYCIPRCVECARCVEFEELGDAACADTLCSDCWLRLPKCNFCNSPYCNQHANQQCILPGSSGFVCDVCHVQLLRSSYD